jgi:poly-gamma-glutamate synthesis protein (capsule biosynthesis protein)
VNIANNHILDFGPEGLIETMRTLKQAGIFYVGAGGNKAEATQPIIISTHGINIGIIGFTDNEPDWKAEQDKPGTNYIRVGNIEFLQKTIASLRLQADIIIVSAHWGPNMQEQPTQEFIDFAHKIIDCGTDIFHGHSAHIPQGIEIYHKKLILYDTGDFVDDYAIDERLHNDQSCFFIVTLDKSGLINVKLIPITIENMQANKAETAIHNVIMKRIKALSKQFETSIDDNDMIVIR